MKQVNGAKESKALGTKGVKRNGMSSKRSER